MPLLSLNFLGDWSDQNGSVRGSVRFEASSEEETTYRIAMNPKARQKIEKAWGHEPHNFTISVVNFTLPPARILKLATKKQPQHIYENPPEFAITRHWGVYGVDEFPKQFFDTLGPLHCRRDAINLVYTTNFTNPIRYVPMTSWILAHRIAHIFQVARNITPSSVETVAAFKEFNYAIYDAYRNLADLIIGLGRDDHLAETKWGYYFYCHKEVIHKCFTMRSAVNGIIDVDFPGELIAQHIISGGVRCTRTGDKKLDFHLAEMERVCAEMIPALLDKMVGYVFCL